MKKLVGLLVAALFSISPVAMATDTATKTDTGTATAKPADAVERAGLILNARVGLNLIQANDFPNSQNRMTFSGGVGAEYYFTPVVGTFINADFTNRGIKGTVVATSTTESASANFIDVPFGLGFNTGSRVFGAGRSEFRLGGYMAQPLSKNLTGDPNITTALASVTTKTFFGIYLDNLALFPAGESLMLGYTVWVKIPVSAAVQYGSVNLDYKSTELGLGLAVGF
jgi:hypothetical protein